MTTGLPRWRSYAAKTARARADGGNVAVLYRTAAQGRDGGGVQAGTNVRPSAGLKGALTTLGQDVSALQARRLPSAGNGHLWQNLVPCIMRDRCVRFT